MVLEIKHIHMLRHLLIEEEKRADVSYRQFRDYIEQH